MVGPRAHIVPGGLLGQDVVLRSASSQQWLLPGKGSLEFAIAALVPIMGKGKSEPVPVYEVA